MILINLNKAFSDYALFIARRGVNRGKPTSLDLTHLSQQQTKLTQNGASQSGKHRGV